LRTEGGIDNEKLFFASSQDAVDFDLTALDAQDCARTSVNGLVFNAASIRKYHNNFAFLFGSDYGL
jgi:hypothetical protein